MGTDTLVIRFHGELDLPAALALRPRCSDLSLQFPHHDVLVELRDVTFIDASGLGLLVSLRSDRVRRGARLVVRNAAPPVARLLRLAALDRAFPEAERSWRREEGAEAAGAPPLALADLPP